MSVENNVKDMIHDLKQRKEMWVEDHPDNPDMPTNLLCYRNGELVVQSYAMADRDKMLTLANLLAFGTACNEIAASFETLQSHLEKNPVTELDWGPEEMAQLAAEYDGKKKGWVHDALMLTAYDRDGNHFTASLEWTVEDGKVVWGEEHVYLSTDEGGAKQAGVVHDAFVQIMANDTILTAIEESEGDGFLETINSSIGSVDQWIHSDIATVKMALRQGLAIAAGLSAEKDSERAKRADVLMRASVARDTGFALLDEVINE